MRVVRMTGPDETTSKVIEDAAGLIEKAGAALGVVSNKITTQDAVSIFNAVDERTAAKNKEKTSTGTNKMG